MDLKLHDIVEMKKNTSGSRRWEVLRVGWT